MNKTTFTYRTLLLISLFISSQIFSSTIPSLKNEICVLPANFTADVTTICNQEFVTFTDLSLNADTYLWDFNDGTTSTEQNPSKIYTVAGNYLVRMTATNTTTGCEDIFQRLIRVNEATAGFTEVNTFGCGPLVVNFTDNSIVSDNQSIASYLWDFGDGTTSGDISPSHNYTLAGIYSVSLTIITSNGCESTRTKNNIIEVIGPDVEFENTIISGGCGPTTIQFTDTTIPNSPILSWFWTFGDGATSTEQNPTHMYATEDVFDITLTVTDADGCSRLLVKPGFIDTIDNESPEAFCNNITVQLDANGFAEVSVIDVNNNSTDDCNIESLNLSESSFSCADIPEGQTEGQVVVMLTVTDSQGNMSTCNSSITVQDIIPPTISCLPTLSISADIGACSASNVVLQIPPANDNCTVSSVTNDAPTILPLGLTTITWTATDQSGNQVTCTQDIIVEDTEIPLAVCQNIDVILINGIATISAQQLDGGSTDNCNIQGFSVNESTFTCDNIGENSIIFTVLDSNGNQSSCNAIVTVSENEAPIANCQNITVQLDAFGVVEIVASQLDNNSFDECSDVTFSINVTTFSCENIGDNTVEFTVFDLSGNSSTCTTIVTVEDNIAPQAVCQNLNIVLDANEMATITAEMLNNQSTDACGIASVTANQINFDCSDVGENIIILTVTDINGNVATCEATVSVTETEEPVAVCQNITLQLDENGQVTLNPNQVDGGSFDNCEFDSITVDTTQFTCDDLGQNFVILTATDTSGNSDTCLVSVFIEDIIAPTIACQDIDVSINEDGFAEITSADITSQLFDNCNIESIILSQQMFTCDDVGSSVITITATDLSGNISQCDTTVTIIDMIDPLVVCESFEIVLGIDGTATLTPENITSTISDNCSIDTITLSNSTYTCDNLGDNLVEIVVTDTNGNMTDCIAMVTVIDNTIPVAQCQNIIITLDSNGVAVLTPSQIDNGSTDNCGIDAFQLSTSQFSCSDIGENNVTFMVIDETGNMDSCTAIVTVIENEFPVANCQNISVTINQTGFVEISANDVNNGSSDNCGIATMSIDTTIFSCEDIGINEVTLTISDFSGNTTTCTALVTVNENTINPVAICQNVTAILDENGTVTILPIDMDNGSLRNVCDSTLSLDLDTFSCEDAGQFIPVVLTVANGNGNEDSCSALVHVVDNTPPSINCPQETIIIAAQAPYQLPDYILNETVSFSDNCFEQSSYTQSPASGNFAEAGETEIIITVTDPSGNTSTCSFIVFVDPTLNINEVKRPEINLFPNPTSESFSLANAEILNITTITILDITGRTLKKFQTNNLNGSEVYNISELNSATYIVLISTTEGQLVQQLVKE